MGLSNEERWNGLYHAVSHISEKAEHLEGFQYERIDAWSKQLWHALLGKINNSSHWVLGSSASNEVTWSSTSPWALAINAHCRDILLKEESEILRSRRKTPVSRRFNAFENFLNIAGLLSRQHTSKSALFEIYSWSEQAIYYLRRYDDEMLAELNPLSVLLSNIQGECFRIFSSDETYARAYILNAVCKKIYGTFYPYAEEQWDGLTKFLDENCGHHDLSRVMSSEEIQLKNLAEYHVKLVQAKDCSTFLRATCFLELAGQKFYEQLFKKFIDALKANTRQTKVLKSIYEKCKVSKEDIEKKRQKAFEETRESPLSIYGTDYL